jgi:hypothetical protein
VDPQVALKRVTLQAGLGGPSSVLSVGERIAAAAVGSRPYLYVDLAELQAVAGDDAAALSSLAKARAIPPSLPPDMLLQQEIASVTAWLDITGGTLPR